MWSTTVGALVVGWVFYGLLVLLMISAIVALWRDILR